MIFISQIIYFLIIRKFPNSRASIQLTKKAFLKVDDSSISENFEFVMQQIREYYGKLSSREHF